MKNWISFKDLLTFQFLGILGVAFVFLHKTISEPESFWIVTTAWAFFYLGSFVLQTNLILETKFMTPDRRIDMTYPAKLIASLPVIGIWLYFKPMKYLTAISDHNQQVQENLKKALT